MVCKRVKFLDSFEILLWQFKFFLRPKIKHNFHNRKLKLFVFSEIKSQQLAVFLIIMHKMFHFIYSTKFIIHMIVSCKSWLKLDKSPEIGLFSQTFSLIFTRANFISNSDNSGKPDKVLSLFVTSPAVSTPQDA